MEGIGEIWRDDLSMAKRREKKTKEMGGREREREKKGKVIYERIE